jgi:hypothetical protein
MQKVVGSSPIIRSESPCKTAGTVAWKVNYPSLMATLRCRSLLPSTTEASRWLLLITTMNSWPFVVGGFSETCWKTAMGGHVAAARVNSY